MKFFLSFLWQRRKAAGVFCLFCAVFLAAFWLYRLPLGAVAYPALLCALAGILFLGWEARDACRRHRRLQEIAGLSGSLMEGFPEPRTLEEADYQEIIRLLRQEQRDRENQMSRRYEEMVEYYTIWAHQIKTPIASMKLTLQNQDSPLARRASEELFRIEQYVEMVLMFLRLDSSSTDYVFREYGLDGIIRQAARKFSTQFINKKVRLLYEPVEARVVTDSKWLLFVVEQVLSNAVKYTPSGGTVTIGWEAPGTLYVRDTGIGIAPEDLPRIFERGYTGYNGRRDQKASGIGLYLCRRICRNLGHTISAQSVPGEGTVIRLGLEQKKTEAR